MNKLERWRKQIDTIDEKILTSLSQRVDIIQKIGKFKKENKISTLDKKRWEDILNSKLKKAEELRLPKRFIKDLLNLIHKYSLKIQKNIDEQD